MRNRSVPADTVLPHITYQNVAEALAWLTKAFGFTEHYRYGEPGGPVQGAQIHLGDAWIMLNSARAGRASFTQLGAQTQSLTHSWLFSRHARDVCPDEWGATIAGR